MPPIDVARELDKARLAVCETDADPRIGWAWKNSEYRSSALRAFHGPTGSLTISDEGIPSLEAAISTLLSDQRVAKVWRDEDLWSRALSLLAIAWRDSDFDMRSAVRDLVAPGPVRTIAALGNVTWESPPASLDDLTIAKIRTADDVASLIDSLDLDPPAIKGLTSYSERLISEYSEYVVVTTTSERQGELAFTDFERDIDDMVGLVLMLSDRLDEHGIFSLRGAANRPGVRGTTLDRSALGALLARNGAGELGANVLTITRRRVDSQFHWNSADPLPLDRLLDARLRPLVSDLIRARDPIAQRLRVAARWYARAFWADGQDDAALAVCVALDSMLTEKEALPGAVSKGRFALLERNPDARGKRFERYDEVYNVRSAIVHGGDATRRLVKLGGVRSILEDARWIAGRLLELRDISTPEDEKALRGLWNGLQWGTLAWTFAPAGDRPQESN